MKEDKIKKINYKFNKEGKCLEEIFINMLWNNLKFESIKCQPNKDEKN